MSNKNKRDKRWKTAQRGVQGLNAKPKFVAEKQSNVRDGIALERDNISKSLKEFFDEIPEPLTEAVVASLPDDLVEEIIQHGGFSIEDFIKNVIESNNSVENFKDSFLSVISNISHDMLHEAIDGIVEVESDNLKDFIQSKQTIETTHQFKGIKIDLADKRGSQEEVSSGTFKVKMTLEIEPDDNFVAFADKLQKDKSEGD